MEISARYRTNKKQDYTDLINKKANRRSYSGIRKDSARTFASDEEYIARTGERILIRVLNSFCTSENCPYVQPMNAIAGPLIYVMPEMDAYYCLKKMITELMPTYWIPKDNYKQLLGAWAGSFLVADCLKICDSEVLSHLGSLHPYAYAFPAVTSI
eukprot:UN28739